MLTQQFLYWFPEYPLKFPCKSQTLGPLGDLQGTSSGRRVSAGYFDQNFLHKHQLNVEEISTAKTIEKKNFQPNIKLYILISNFSRSEHRVPWLEIAKNNRLKM